MSPAFESPPYRASLYCLGDNPIKWGEMSNFIFNSISGEEVGDGEKTKKIELKLSIGRVQLKRKSQGSEGFPVEVSLKEGRKVSSLCRGSSSSSPKMACSDMTG